MKKIFSLNCFPAQKSAKWVVKQCKWLNTNASNFYAEALSHYDIRYKRNAKLLSGCNLGVISMEY